MTYVVITFLVLLFLNIYCSKGSYQLFYSSNKTAMVEKCQLVSDEIAQLDVINADGIRESLARLGTLSVTPMYPNIIFAPVYLCNNCMNELMEFLGMEVEI